MKGKPKMAKTSQHSKKATVKPKNDRAVRVLEEYTNLLNREQQWVTDSYLERIARELVEWARTDDKALTLTQFFAERGIGYGVFYGWRDRYPIMKESMELALIFLANRREAGAVNKKYDASTIAFMMPHYSPEWKDMLEYKAALKAKHESQSQGNVLVQIAPFEDTDVKRIGDKE